MSRGSDDAPFPEHWIIDRVTFEEFARRSMLPPEERAAPELFHPFGVLDGDLEALKAQMQPGDELCSFASPPESWRILCGRAGLALLRDGKVVTWFITALN